MLKCIYEWLINYFLFVTNETAQRSAIVAVLLTCAVNTVIACHCRDDEVHRMKCSEMWYLLSSTSIHRWNEIQTSPIDCLAFVQILYMGLEVILHYFENQCVVKQNMKHKVFDCFRLKTTHGQPNERNTK